MKYRDNTKICNEKRRIKTLNSFCRTNSKFLNFSAVTKSKVFVGIK